MATKLIALQDGILVEVETTTDQAEQISGGMAEKVNSTLDKITPLLIKTCKPVTEAWKELKQDIHVEKMEIELGLSFEGEGNIYITKSKAGASLTIKLILNPNSQRGQIK